MISKASLFLAFRYMRPRRSFVSIITLISILGVMLGVGVLVAVMAIFKGFQTEFRNLLLGFEPHLVLVQRGISPQELPPGAQPPEASNWREVLQVIREQPGVVSALPMAAGEIAVLLKESDPVGVTLLGLKPGDDNLLLKKLAKRLATDEAGNPLGRLDLNDENIIITDKLANKIGAKLGDKLEVYASDNIRQMIREARLVEEESKPVEAFEDVTVIPKDLTIVAILSADTAGDRCYAPLFVAQELFQLEDRVSALEVELADPDQVEVLAEDLDRRGVLPFDWGMRTWSSDHRQMITNVENQKSLMWFLLVFIMLVAAICVMNTIITVTVQKRREIGVMTALGAPASQVIVVFLTQALVVALCGVGLGIAGGMTFLAFRNDFRDFIAKVFDRDIFPQEVYFLSGIPSDIDFLDVAAVSGLAVVLCLLAALIPSWFAGRVDPAVALRD